MAVKVQMCEKQFAEWCTKLPRTKKSIDSPYFCLEGQDWYFRLTTIYSESSETGFWSMRIKKKNTKKTPASFLLIVYVTGNTKDLYVAHKTIKGQDTEIFSYDSFFDNLSQVKIVEDKVTFVFAIDYAIRDKEIQLIEREHKSVQTSPYLNCLKNLSLDLSKLMDGGSAPDVQLKCGDYICPAHKLILGARSEVFSAMLQSDMLEGREGLVEIIDMEPKVFKIFIQYLYTGILPELTEDTASLLYEAGDKYQFESLKGRCSDFLVENMTTETACGIFAMADVHSDHDLKERVLTYILQEKIPNNDEVWSKFYNDHPDLAFEVLTCAYKILNFSQ